MARDRPRILLVQPRRLDRHELRLMRDAGRYDFVAVEGLAQEVLAVADPLRWLEVVSRRHRGRIDGVMGTHEHHAVLLASALGERLGLPGPPLRAVLTLGNKFWSRRLQRRVAPEATPRFALFDPAVTDPERPPLPYPFFVKPVRGVGSFRATAVRNADELRRAVRLSWRERFAHRLMTRPWSRLGQSLGLPAAPTHWIAEELLDGRHSSVDGYVQNGQVVVYGVTDTDFYPGEAETSRTAFLRSVYPSRRPPAVQAQLAEATARVIRASGFDNGLFHAEVFSDAAGERVYLIEVNPRMASTLADVYRRVDGFSPYDALAAIAVGELVSISLRAGRSRVAALFDIRDFSGRRRGGLPRRLRERLRRECPQGFFRFTAALDPFDDPHARRLGTVSVGGQDLDELEHAWRRLRAVLGPEFEPRRRAHGGRGAVLGQRAA